MNTKFKLLKKTTQAVMIAALLCMAGMMNATQAQSAWEQAQNYLFYLVYADYQTCEHLMPEREGSSVPDAIRRNLLPVDEGSMLAWIWDEEPYPETRKTGLIGLAKNEKEGFQVFFREQEKERNLRIEVSPFLNSQNEALQHTVYLEEFFWPEGIWDENSPNADSLAEALVPYAGEIKRTSLGHNKVFYVELQSSKNQTPGEYVSTITVYDGNEVIDTRTVTAKVWDFALPENHKSEVVTGLYNRNSGYGSTSSFLTLNGIQVDNNGDVVPEDLEEAKRILNGYQNCLLEHGVSTYELPRWLMQDDPKAAELTMADPRRKVFTVPVLYGDLNNSSSDFKPEAQQVLQQYKDIVYDNSFLNNKAFFYPYDEPENATDFACIDQFCNVISNYWSGYHATVPFYSDYDTTIAHFEGKIDILCPHKDMFDPFDPENPNVDFTPYEDNLQDFMTRDHTWRYFPGGKQNGGIECFIDAISTVGTMRRVVFWQQYIINSDGILIWNCAYLPNWVKKTLPASSGIQKGNGDGVLLYPGTMFGQDAATPVVSLRLKQLAEGIDDNDYLCLAKEFISSNYVTNILNSGVTPSEALAVFYHFTQLDYLCKIFNRQYDYDAWSCRFMNITRHYIGNALDAANTEHDWSEWQTAVLPDETHAGLEIRTCSHCGAQESRPKPYSSLYRFVGTEDNQWANLVNWANTPETLPSSGEAVVIAHDCEIDTTTTVFKVVLNDGFNLTINGGATLTSRSISTGEGAQVIIKDGAQLINASANVAATMEKDVTAYGNSNPDGWYTIASPMNGTVIAGSGFDTCGYDLYRYNETNLSGEEWENYKANQEDFATFEKGRGYLYANGNAFSPTFTGTLNASAVTIPLTCTERPDDPLSGFNLIGNPFPHEIYKGTGAAIDNANLASGYYTLTNEGTWQVHTFEDAIQPGQGILVKATAPTVLTISKSNEEAYSETGDAKTARGVLRISVVGDNGQDHAFVYFGQGADLDKVGDMAKKAMSLAIRKKNRDFAIVHIDKKSDAVELVFATPDNGSVTLNVKANANDFEYLHLIDSSAGADIDLLQQPNYTFQVSGQVGEKHFKLLYKQMEK